MNVNLDPGRIRDLLFRTFQNPTADLVTSAFVLSAILVVLLMLVLMLLLLLTPRRRKIVKIRRYRRIESEGAVSESGPSPVSPTGEQAEPETLPSTGSGDPGSATSAPEAGRWSARRIMISAASFVFSVPVLVAMALVGGYWVSGTDDFCARTCHAQVQEVHQARKLDHASCADCHESPGLTGIPENVLSRAAMGVAQLRGDEPDGSAIVRSEACLRCHGATVESTVETERGIRISHKEPTEAGATCVSCHPQTGHDARREYTMSSCLPCHGGGEASTECSVCHVNDPYDARPRVGSSESTSTLGSGKIAYPVVRVANRNCGGCHDQERECDTCHGLRMPHNDAFLAGGHARQAAWEKKEMCYKCHEPATCVSGCHIGPFPGHYPGWKNDHKRSPRTALCVCHSEKWQRKEPMCVLCHDF